MGKRYFCDYCDRSFQDSLHNRKKHLNGLQHLKAKKVWYDMFRDAATILVDEQNKRPCWKFLLIGQCDFGSKCRFSHMSGRDLQELSLQVEEERRAKEWPLDTVELPEVHLEDWLEKRAKRLSSAPSSRGALLPTLRSLTEAREAGASEDISVKAKARPPGQFYQVLQEKGEDKGLKGWAPSPEGETDVLPGEQTQGSQCSMV